MTELLDAKGRPSIAHQPPVPMPLSEGGFKFPIPAADRDMLVAWSLVANEGQVPDAPIGKPIWENDPFISLVVYEVAEGFKELREEIAGARDAAIAEMEDQTAELRQHIARLEEDRKGDVLEIQKLREMIERMGGPGE